jgi:hypothetical protein
VGFSGSRPAKPLAVAALFRCSVLATSYSVARAGERGLSVYYDRVLLVHLRSSLLLLLTVLLYLLHQDFFLWREARPLALGFLPIGLVYHAVYTLACAGLMLLLCRFAWPSHLDRDEDGKPR